MKGAKALSGFVPDIVHGHILTRGILFAYYLSLKYKVPYLITEHWSRYFQQNGTYNGRLRKLLTRFLVRRSCGVIAVSNSLGLAMKAHGLGHEKFYVVSNAIDTNKFIPAEPLNETSRAVILHVSCFEDKSRISVDCWTQSQGSPHRSMISC